MQAYQFLTTCPSEARWVLYPFAVNTVVAILKVQCPLAKLCHRKFRSFPQYYNKCESDWVPPTHESLLSASSLFVTQGRGPNSCSSAVCILHKALCWPLNYICCYFVYFWPLVSSRCKMVHVRFLSTEPGLRFYNSSKLGF